MHNRSDNQILKTQDKPKSPKARQQTQESPGENNKEQEIYLNHGRSGRGMVIFSEKNNKEQ